MRVTFVFLAACLLPIASANCQENSEQFATLPQEQNVSGKSLTEKASYLLGYNFFMEFKLQKIEIDVERMIAGMKDAAAGREPEMSEELIRAVEDAFQKMVMEKQEAAFKDAAEKNLRDGEDFLSQNGRLEGVKQLESGLQYKVIRDGTGPAPKTGEIIKFHFKGKFPDGTELESSGDTPMQYRIGTSIMPGMAEAFSRMKVGDLWIVYIPGKLAFGIQGSPPRIGPNQTLIYELELIEIAK